MPPTPHDALPGQRVLVTGAAGFLGSSVVRTLLAVGAEVHGIVRPTTDDWRIRERPAGLELHHLDLRETEKLEALCRDLRPPYIIHTAVEGVSLESRDSWAIVANNILGTTTLLQATADVDYRRFLHLGGSSEYGRKPHPIRETDCLEPVTRYGASKAAASILCQQSARAEEKPLTVLRPFSIYGPAEPAKRLIPTAIRALLEGTQLTLTRAGLRRDWIYVEDVAAACVQALVAETPPGEIFNIGSGQQFTNEEVVTKLSEISGRKLLLADGDYPARRSDTSHWVAEIEKARLQLGWTPQYSLAAGLRATWEWSVRNRP